MILTVLIVISFLVGFIVFRKIEIVDYTPSSKALNPFYKISIYIIEQLYNKKSRRINKYIIKSQVVDNLKQINPTDRSQKSIKRFYVDKMAISFFIIFVTSLLSIVVILSQNNKEVVIDNKYVQRGNYKANETLNFSVGEDIKNQQVMITVDGQELNETEVFDMFREVYDQLPTTILGDNASLMEIRSNMKLPTQIEGKPLEIEWNTDNFEVISSDGEVNNEDLDKNGVIANLTVTFSYKEYSEENIITIKVLPPAWTNLEIITRNVLAKIKESNKSTITDDFIELPQDIDGKTIAWSENKSKSGILVIFIGIIAAIVIYYGKDNELKTEVKKRDQQLLSDYPDIVSKLTLLLGAGMTVKGAWQKIALDYREKKESNSKYYRFAYEEMLITYYEIIGGVSEPKAYEDFGKRSKNQRYMKLSALITQNLRKGSRGLSQILESESIDAFEDRKSYAKIIGEEAGTKLMVPMFLNLILVLIIIIIPACMSFQM
jgi:hypothetical protein